MLVTYGHGTESAGRTVAVLQAASIAQIVDIRIAPNSQRNPQFAHAELERWLPEAGIAYRWDKRLGGYRRPSAGNPDIAWREDTYRGYAEHMRGTKFLAAINAVLADAAAIEDAAAGGEPHRVAVMCSESSWQHCHRRLVADFAQVSRGMPVWHLAHDATLTAHVPSPGLRVRDDGLLIYDSNQSPLF
jgi:uncharacterized protein (DUF488 family)